MLDNRKSWTIEERLSLMEFCTKNGGFHPRTTIASEWIKFIKSDRTIESVDSKIRSLEDEGVLFRPEAIREAKREEIDFDIMRDEFNDWLGRTPIKIEKPKDAKYERTLVLSDLHSPYTRWNSLFEVVDWAHQEGIKHLWLNGDTEEWRTLSRFTDLREEFIGPDGKKYEPTLDNEMKFNLYMREYLSQAFERIDEISGNHRDRPMKYFLRSGLHPEVVELLVKRQEHILYEKDFPNIHMVNTNIAEDRYVVFYGSLGDCGLCHIEYTTNRVPGKQALQADEWIKIFEEVCPPLKGRRLIIQSHSHRPVKMVGRYHRVIMEAPALCVPMKYMLSSDGRQYCYPIPGYIVLVQDEGKTDVNKTNFYLLDE